MRVAFNRRRPSNASRGALQRPARSGDDEKSASCGRSGSPRDGVRIGAATAAERRLFFARPCRGSEPVNGLRCR